MRRSPLRPSFFPSLSCQFVDQKIVEFPSTLDRSNKPTRSCTTACPSFARWATIFRRDLPSLQTASATSDDNPSATDQGIHLLQLLLNLSTTLKKHFTNPLSQVHECFDVHP